ncbi:MAG: 50S ribosomal protein L18 [Paludibacteraceae bacterium]|jgi:large subunit ribosomal protein L18|nr:50S ribosomal protein L18 [Paludibacteraceae bacterium]
MEQKIARRLKIKQRIRSKISGTTTCPRMSVFRSNSQIYVQLIDDTQGKTLASASSLGIKEKMTKTEKAAQVGKLIAQNAQKAGISTIVFDRNGYLYHGRVKQLADAAREAGLKF